jgi:hypothetical protein
VLFKYEINTMRSHKALNKISRAVDLGSLWKRRAIGIIVVEEGHLGPTRSFQVIGNPFEKAAIMIPIPVSEDDAVELWSVFSMPGTDYTKGLRELANIPFPVVADTRGSNVTLATVDED